MDFRSLTYFITVAGELNITKAAALLNMSQPPLSSQIRQLEDWINTIHRESLNGETAYAYDSRLAKAA